jgi:O-antigen/teichoic acid export membrane protein
VPYDAWVVYALILRMIVCSASQAASAYFKSTNEAGPLAAANALHIALVLSLCILLSPSLGALGTALALLVSETLSNACLLLIFASKHLGVRPLGLVVKHQGLGLLSFALSAVCAMMAYRTVGRDSLVNLAFGGAVWTLMVSVPALFLVFSASQRRWIWGSAKAFAGRFALSG